MSIKTGETDGQQERHTPTPRPWRSSDLSRPSVKRLFISAGSKTIAVLMVYEGDSTKTPEEQEANTEFIVRAANSHDALVSALQAVQEDINRPLECDGFKLRGSTLDKITSALAAATSSPQEAQS